MKAGTQIYVRVQPNTNRAVICVFLRLIQQMLPLQKKFVDYNLLCYCYNTASVLHFHHPRCRGRWLAACTRSRKRGLLWHAARNESMLCDVCAYEGNCWQFQPGQMRIDWMEHIFPGRGTWIKVRDWMEKSKPEMGNYLRREVPTEVNRQEAPNTEMALKLESRNLDWILESYF